MVTDPTESARRLARRLDRDDQGAITLAALAACLILIMVGLTIWDAGRAARDKIDVQNAADTAAFSQAAIRARSMNMLAFTNVAKRSVVGMHSLYFGMWTAYVLWWEERCREAQNSFSPEARLDCDRNEWIVESEGGPGGDWSAFSGNVYRQQGRRFAAANKIIEQMMPPSVAGGSPAGGSEFAYRNEVIALDDYQRYLVEVTPWWAWMESLVRGTRNGAHVTTSFPLPGPLSSPPGPGWIRSSLGSTYTFGQNNTNGAARSVFDFEVHDPNPPSPTLNSDALLKRPLFNATPGAGSEPTGTETCIPTGAAAAAGFGVGLRSDTRSRLTTPLWNALQDNVALHRRRSEADAADPAMIAAGLQIAIAFAPPGVNGFSAGTGCFWSQQLFATRCPGGSLTNICRHHALPYLLNSPGNTATDLMARSNIVFSYRHTPGRAMSIGSSGEVTGAGRDASKRNLLSHIGYRVQNPGNVTYETTGYWSMARAEIVYPHLRSGRNPAAGPTGNPAALWLWRPGWTAKMRPMALPREWRNLPYDLNAAFHATDQYLALAGQLGLLNNNTFGSLNDIKNDLQFMEKATRTLDSTAIDGTVK